MLLLSITSLQLSACFCCSNVTEQVLPIATSANYQVYILRGEIIKQNQKLYKQKRYADIENIVAKQAEINGIHDHFNHLSYGKKALKVHYEHYSK